MTRHLNACTATRVAVATRVAQLDAVQLGTVTLHRLVP